MLGAIIGDLAADTWQRHKVHFFRQLIDEQARPSIYGTTALKMAQPVVEEGSIELNSDELNWANKELVATVLYALCGWVDASCQHVVQYADELHHRLYMEKEGFYAANILSSLVFHQRTGKSKREAAKKSWGYPTGLRWEKDQDTPLGAVARALDALRRSFDFTSALHIAVKSPVNPHLTATLTGLLAESLYGCKYGLIKRKYAKETIFEIHLPQSIVREYQKELVFISQHKMNNRFFYPKNEARTNVERCGWITIANLWKDLVFDVIKYQQLCLSFEPDWDNRYGIYLDDGWFYVYRCGFVQNRFRVEEDNHNLYRIVEVQKNIDNHLDDYLAINEAFCSLGCG